MDGYYPHDHQEYVEGCFRCDLSRDEVGDDPDLTEAEKDAFMDALAAIRHAHADEVERLRAGIERIAAHADKLTHLPAAIIAPDLRALLGEGNDEWATDRRHALLLRGVGQRPAR